jgi:hypothetical protein
VALVGEQPDAAVQHPLVAADADRRARLRDEGGHGLGDAVALGLQRRDPLGRDQSVDRRLRGHLRRPRRGRPAELLVQRADGGGGLGGAAEIVPGAPDRAAAAVSTVSWSPSAAVRWARASRSTCPLWIACPIATLASRALTSADAITSAPVTCPNDAAGQFAACNVCAAVPEVPPATPAWSPPARIPSDP